VGLYAASAEAVSAIEAQIGEAALFAMLAEVGGGALFEDAYRGHAGEGLDEFIAQFTGDLALAPMAEVGTAFDGSGNLTWTLGAFAANSDVRVTITGKSYDLGFTVRTDGAGMYRGTFGSTAPLGSYTLTAQSATLRATTTIDTASR